MTIHQESQACSATSARSIAKRYPPRGVMLATTGGQLHVLRGLRRGVAREPAVVLLHGASGNACDMGLDLFDVLSRKYQVLAFDRPGHGWSDRPGGAADADPGRQANLILHTLHGLGLRQILIVGHSWSGGLALAMALSAPHLVAGAVLLAGATHPWPGGRIAWYNTVGAAPVVGRAFANFALLGQRLLPSAIEAVFWPQTPPPGFIERTSLPLLFRPDHFLANAQDMAALCGFLSRQSERYQELASPVIAIVSDADTIVPMAHSIALARQSSRVELRVLRGLGHALQHVAVAEAANAVDDLAGKLRRQRKASWLEAAE